MSPNPVLVAKHRQINQRADWLKAKGANSMENQHQAVNVDLDRGERENAAQVYRLDRQDRDRDEARTGIFCVLG
jgi:hypothetical protein